MASVACGKDGFPVFPVGLLDADAMKARAMRDEWAKIKKALENCNPGAQKRARTEQTRQSYQAQYAKMGAEKTKLLQTASKFALDLQAKMLGAAPGASNMTDAMGSGSGKGYGDMGAGAMGSGAMGSGGNELAIPDTGNAARFKEWLQDQFTAQADKMKWDVHSIVNHCLDMQRKDILTSMVESSVDDPEDRAIFEKAGMKHLLSDDDERTKLEDKALDELLDNPATRAMLEKRAVKLLLKHEPEGMRMDLQGAAIEQLIADEKEALMSMAAKKWLADADDCEVAELQNIATEELKEQLEPSVRKELLSKKIQKRIRKGVQLEIEKSKRARMQDKEEEEEDAEIARRLAKKKALRQGKEYVD